MDVDKLKQENAKLVKELAELKKNGGTVVKKASPIWPILTVIFALAVAALSYLHFGMTSERMTEDQLGSIAVELWSNGTPKDTVFRPTYGLEYTVQIGAFKDSTLRDLSYGFEDIMLRRKDSLFALSVGSYTSLPDAQELLGHVIELGMENAFIVAYKDGNPVGLLSVETAKEE